MTKQQDETLIINGKEVKTFGEVCEICINDRDKNQVLLLDFEHYPCLLMCLRNGIVEIAAEIKRDSENYKHFEHNQLIDVNNFSLDVNK